MVRIIEPEDSRWGVGKSHIAGDDGFAACGTTFRQNPSHNGPANEATCKKCRVLIGLPKETK